MVIQYKQVQRDKLAQIYKIWNQIFLLMLCSVPLGLLDQHFGSS